MRSTLDVRTCHLLRMMRSAAPVEWTEGLPFPPAAAMQGVEPAMAEPEEVSISDWLDSRGVRRFADASTGEGFSLPAAIGRLAGQAHDHLDALARGVSALLDPDNLPRRARSLAQLRRRELARVQLVRRAR
jgi:hypothetical protein